MLYMQVKAVVSMLYMTVFCGISPVGVAVGMALKQSGEVGQSCYNEDIIILTATQDQGGAALIVFQGLATGSLLYVVFFEILEKERKKAVPGVLQVWAGGLCISLPWCAGTLSQSWLHLHGLSGPG